MISNLISIHSILSDHPLYLDPGSGSLLLQLAIAAVIGLGVIIRMQWARIKKMFGKESETVDEEDREDG